VGFVVAPQNLVATHRSFVEFYCSLSKLCCNLSWNSEQFVKVVILVRFSEYCFVVGLSGVVGCQNFSAIHWSFVASHQRFEHFVKGKTRFVKALTLAKMFKLFCCG
jgi:hypothetical protein